MKSKHVFGLAAAALAALLAVTAAAQAGKNWLTTVSLTDAGHRIGNPAAKVKLTEYISYTCPHCAEFAREGEGALQLAYIGPGKVNLEIRHMLRDPIDLTVAMLANCGPAAKFPLNHNAFLAGQNKWIAPLVRPSAAQEQRWRTPGAAGRRAIATDFHLYDIMVRRGYTRTEADRCLANEAMARKLAAASDKDWKMPGVEGTPTFAIDGVVLAGTHSWKSLEPQLAARF
jgi:protein-disulfide isomerase